MENKNNVTRTWKVYGLFDGAIRHRMRYSFFPSRRFDFSTAEDGTRVIDIQCSDKTGTNEFIIVSVTRPTADLCERELEGQLSDGIFEDIRSGDVEEIGLD